MSSAILITDADGFIGSRLTEMLVAKGYKVKVLSQYNSFNNRGWLEDINYNDQVEVFTGVYSGCFDLLGVNKNL